MESVLKAISITVIVSLLLLGKCSADTKLLPMTYRSFTGGGKYCSQVEGGAAGDKTVLGRCKTFSNKVDSAGKWGRSSCNVGGTCATNLFSPNNGNAVNHPDFETLCCGQFTNFVKSTLGPDRKPVLDTTSANTMNALTFKSGWGQTSVGSKNAVFGPVQGPSAYITQGSYTISVTYTTTTDPTGFLSSNYDFQDWFRDSFRNKRITTESLQLTAPSGSTSYVYDSNQFFFPLDKFVISNSDFDTGVIFPLAPYEEKCQSMRADRETGTSRPLLCGINPDYKTQGFSKFSFCAEHHSYFKYQGTEVFDFSGDDDVWVFINDQLVIDLGGIHPPAPQTVYLKNLNLKVGEIYNFDYFMCERHTSGSGLKMTTSITPFCSVTQSASPFSPVVAGTSFLSATNAGSKIPNVSFQSLTQTNPAGIIINGGAINGNNVVIGGTGSVVIPQTFQLSAGFVVTFTLTVASVNGFALQSANNKGLISLRLKPALNSGTTALAVDFKTDSTVSAWKASAPTAPSTTPLMPWLLNLFAPNPDGLTWLDGKEISASAATHDYRIAYLANPNWVHVYVDDMSVPLVTMKNVNLADVELASTKGAGIIELAFNNNAFAPAWSSVTLSHLKIDVTNADYQKTTLVMASSNSVAAGSAFTATVQLFDQCGFKMKSGGLKSQFTVGPNFSGLTTTTIDNNDGTYTFSWVVTSPLGQYQPSLSFQNNPLPITLPQVTVSVGALDVSNVMVSPPGLKSLSGDPNVVYKFSLTIQDSFKNLPDTTTGPKLVTATMKDASGSSANCAITVTFNPSTRAYDVTYSASTNGTYTISALASNQPIQNPLFNGVLIGTLPKEIAGQTVNVVQQDHTSVIIIGVTVGVLAPFVGYFIYRMQRYARKWREEKNKRQAGADKALEFQPTLTVNPTFNRGPAGDRFELSNAIDRIKQAAIDYQTYTAMKKEHQEQLRLLNDQLKSLGGTPVAVPRNVAA